MQIGDYVLIRVGRSVFGELKSVSKITNETKTLWKCANGTRIYKDKNYCNHFDSKCLYQGGYSDYAMVISKERKEEIEHEKHVNRVFNDTYKGLEILERNNRLSIKNKEDINNLVNGYLKENVYEKEDTDDE